VSNVESSLGPCMISCPEQTTRCSSATHRTPESPASSTSPRQEPPAVLARASYLALKPMNARQRFQRIMQYQPVDCVPVLALEPYEVSGLERWHQEGLPSGQSPEQHLGMDTIQRVPIDFTPHPPFEPQILSETEDKLVETDSFGAVICRRKDAPMTYYGYIDHPVKDRDDWERHKERFSSGVYRLLRREPQDAISELSSSENPVVLDLFPFFFRLGFYLMGMNRFLTAFYDAPDLIHNMFAFWGGLVQQAIEPLLSQVTPDCVTFAEDLAYKNGPHISPRLYQEFWLPYQDPIIGQLRQHRVPIICMWSSGDLQPLLSLLMAHGFNCTWPVERTAGMDPIELRKRSGPELRLAGGFAKEALIAGPEAINREIARLMPLIKEGGYLPALDDMVPLEVPLDHYRYYVNALRSITL